MKNVKRKPRRPKIPTPESLAASALHYLARMASSEASLRRVLVNRMRRAAMFDHSFAADHARQDELRNAIETIIAKHRKAGILNDAAYAGTKTLSLRREGRSRHYIQQSLARKGIASALTEQALSEGGEDPAQAEIKAARAHAKKRRLGPFRTTPAGDDRKRKDYAAMARAGFSLSIAKQILGGSIDDDEEF